MPTPSSATSFSLTLVKTSPEAVLQGAWYRMPLLGIGYLAAWMREAGCQVAIVDAMFDNLNGEETVGRILKTEPDLVGFTAMTHEINRAAEMARLVKAARPGVKIVLGGPHVTALPRRSLEEYPVFDFGIFGEGEETLRELAEALQQEKPVATIAGLVWRDGAELRQNPGRDWMEDLDRLPRPAWDLYGSSEVYQIFASRGCPYQCIFCMRVLGDKVRFRSPKNVVDEFEWVTETFHPQRIDFSDETFTARKKWALEICDELIKRGLHKKTPWFANGRVNTIDEALLRRMKEAGCVRMGFGIESGNPEILKAARKASSLEQIYEAARLCKKTGLEMEAFYILGFPHETRKTAWDTIRLAARLNTTTAAFGIMVPYPGTEIAEMAARGEGGYRLLSRDWSDFDKHLGNAMELEGLSRKELERLQALAYLWFYLRNFRLRDLSAFFWEKRKAVWKLARKMVGTRENPPE